MPKMFVKQIGLQALPKSKGHLTCCFKRFFSSDENNPANGPNKTDKRRFLRQSQGLHAFRPDEIPENPTIILFPGQGAQFVGMAKSLVNNRDAKDMFDIASDVLKFVRIKTFQNNRKSE